jgi:ankyrin repeat protein
MWELQDGRTPLHIASSNVHLDIVQFLVEQCGVDVRAKDYYGHTALDDCKGDAKSEISAFLRPYMDRKPKMFALCMGLHCRLGVDIPLKILNVDVMQEIAKHLGL